MKVTSYIYNLLPRTLVSRFLLIIILPAIIAQLVAIYIFYDRHWSYVFTSTGKMISGEVKVILDMYDKYGIDFALFEAPILGMRIQYLPKKELKTTEQKSDDILKDLTEAIESAIHRKTIVNLVRDDSEIQILVQLKAGVMQFTRSAKPLINPTSYVFIMWMVSLTFILLIISLMFLRKQIHSILELTKAADAFGRGIGGDHIYKPSGALEIRKAGLAFLRMKDRIERYISKRTGMLAMISHDLKTPLTRMKLQLEMMQESEEVNDMKLDVVSMQRMIASYLDFARGEGGEAFKDVKILEWLQKLNTDSYTNLQISFSSDSINPKVAIKPYSFERAIDNIISNANKYANTLLISVSNEEGQVTIDIEDNGPGISDNQKTLVFGPFYRGDSARNITNTGSVGLGLSIVREIILGHNGSITLMDSSTLNGLKVKIVLPSAEV